MKPIPIKIVAHSALSAAEPSPGQEAVLIPLVAAKAGDALVFRVDGLCCAAEEGQIRNALEQVPGITALRFDVRQRTVSIEGQQADPQQVQQAIAGAGFDAVPLTSPRPARRFRVDGLCCAAEEGQIRRALENVEGVDAPRFDLPARSMEIAGSESAILQSLEAIRKAGFDVKEIKSGVVLAATQAAGNHGVTTHEQESADVHGHGAEPGVPQLVFALVLAILAEAISYFAPDTQSWTGASLLVAAGAIWLAGFSTYRQGFAALRRWRLNINALMSVAVTGAFLIGQWPEAAMVMALYGLAELIEARASERARNAIKALLSVAPKTATLRHADGSWRETPIESIPVGGIVRIRPGERVPIDGEVTAGQGAIDQSPVTGESIPVDKAPGDRVFAGTVNQSGELEVRATAHATDTTLARIIRAVEKAQNTRAPTQRLVDRFAAIYTPAVFVLAIAVALAAPFLLDLTWMQSVYKALVLLVIACPCALVLSTPVTVVSGLAAAARKGILIKGGTYLEQARLLRSVALDKTGTITSGKPKLVHQEYFEQGEGRQLPEAETAIVAAALASRSNHPVSQAIARGLSATRSEATNFAAIAGRGVQGQVQGRAYLLGNVRLMREHKLLDEMLGTRIAQHEGEGRTVTLLADDHGILALFAVADTIKPESAQACAELKKLGVAPLMLTGDNTPAALAVARRAGIDDVRGELLPEDKQRVVKELQAQGPVAMVGDGINDAPSLAQADVGFAMGGAGTDVAMETADVVIMNDDLRRVPATIALSRKTYAVLWQNILLALGIKGVFLGLAVFGGATMWMAVFADVGTSLLVIANGLRLLRA